MIEIFCSLILLSLIGIFLAVVWKKPPVVVAPQPQDRPIPAISHFDPNADVTTVCPVPLASMGCSHDWQKEADQVLEMAHEKKCIIILSCGKCGLIDKTVQTTSAPPKPPPPPPLPPLPRSECRHKWEREKVVVLDSAYEQMSKVKGSNGQWKKDAKSPGLDQDNIEPWMFRKRYISVRVCTVCGEIDRCVASNFEEEQDEHERIEE